MRILAIISLLMLSGCAHIPVGMSGFVVCVGCKVEMKVAVPAAQSVAEKAGAVAGGLLAEYLSGAKK